MRQLVVRGGKRHRQLARRIHAPEQNIRNRLSSADPRIPALNDPPHAWCPRHIYRPAVLQHHNRIRIGRRNRRHQIVLLVWQAQRRGVLTLRHPLSHKHNRHLRGCRGLRRRNRIGAHVVCNLRTRRGLLTDIPHRRGREVDGPSPRRAARPRRNRIAARRVHLRRSAAGEDCHIGMTANDRNALRRRRREGKNAAAVLQQHNTLFLNLLRIVTSAEWIDHAARHRRLVDHSVREHAAHNAMHHVVQPRLRHLPALHGLLQRIAEEVVVARLVHIEPGQRGLHRAMRPAPVGEHKALKSPVLLQHLVQRIVVLARVVAVDVVVRAHYARRMRRCNGDLEGKQIGLTQRALVHHGIQNVAPGLLVVHSVVLNVAHDVVRLHAARHLPNHHAGEDRVLACVLEVASIARLADQVHPPANRHVVSLRAQLAANHRAVEKRRVRVPARGHPNYRRQQRRVAALRSGHAHAHRRVGQVDVRQMQPRNPRNKARPAIVSRRHRSARAQHSPARAMHQLDLLVQRHLVEHQVRARVRIERFIHPWLRRRGWRPGWLRIRSNRSTKAKRQAHHPHRKKPNQPGVTHVRRSFPHKTTRFTVKNSVILTQSLSKGKNPRIMFMARFAA